MREGVPVYLLRDGKIKPYENWHTCRIARLMGESFNCPMCEIERRRREKEGKSGRLHLSAEE